MAKPTGAPKTGGRQKGTPNKVTAEIKSIAQKVGPEAIAKLVTLMRTAESEQVQAAAANSILDRAYGKPAQALVGEDGESPAKIVLEVMWGGSSVAR